MNDTSLFCQAALRFPYGAGITLAADNSVTPRLINPFWDRPREDCPIDSLPHGAKLNFTTKEVIAAFGSVRIVQRLRFARWIIALYQSRDALYPVSQIFAAQRRMESGDFPPLLPSEIKQRKKAH
jgi:hypothetical protein